jgi:hypothetical protein
MQHMILGVNNVLVDIVVLQIKNSMTETPTNTDSDPYIISSDLEIIFFIQWNLSNPTHQGTREMCRIVQDVGILQVYSS